MRPLHSQEVQAVSGAGLLTSLTESLDQTLVPVKLTVVSVAWPLLNTVSDISPELGGTASALVQALT